MQKSILEFTSKLNLVSVYYVIVFYIDAVGNDRFIFRISILSAGLIKCILGPSYDESLLFFFPSDLLLLFSSIQHQKKNPKSLL